MEIAASWEEKQSGPRNGDEIECSAGAARFGTTCAKTRSTAAERLREFELASAAGAATEKRA